MVKVGEAKKGQRTNTWQKFINFAEIGGICNMHHWLMGDGRLCSDYL